MTVICFDGVSIAADSMVSCNDLVVDKNYNKIHILKKGTKFQDEGVICVALAGQLAHITEITQIIEKGQSTFEEFEGSAYIVTDKSCYRIEHTGKWYKDTAKQWALGSGSDVALSALQLGKSAKEAVKHACKLVLGCGGKVRVMQVRKTKRTIKKAPKKGNLSRKRIKSAVDATLNLKKERRLKARVDSLLKEI